jgi:ABC-2 type transport system ATP-binding protein
MPDIQQDGFAISTTALTRQFKGEHGINDLTFSVEKGAVLGFLGPNGAGKTTTIRLLLGLLDAERGCARVLDLDPADEYDGALLRAQTGVLLEDAGLYGRLSAEENLQFFGRMFRMSDEDIRRRSDELLVSIGLIGRKKELVRTWSRGMKQQLGIARAMLHRPRVLFLDEPTAGLDVPAAVAIRNHIRSLAAEHGTTVFVTTHNMAEAASICTSLVVIRDGRKVAEGTPASLTRELTSTVLVVRGRQIERGLSAVSAIPDIATVESTAANEMRIRLSATARPAEIISALVRAGVEVDSASTDEVSLESAFLSLMKVG